MPRRGEELGDLIRPHHGRVPEHDPRAAVFLRLQNEVRDDHDRAAGRRMKPLGIGKDVGEREVDPRIVRQADDASEGLLAQDPDRVVGILGPGLQQRVGIAHDDRALELRPLQQFRDVRDPAEGRAAELGPDNRE